MGTQAEASHPRHKISTYFDSLASLDFNSHKCRHGKNGERNSIINISIECIQEDALPLPPRIVFDEDGDHCRARKNTDKIYPQNNEALESIADGLTNIGCFLTGSLINAERIICFRKNGQQLVESELRNKHILPLSFSALANDGTHTTEGEPDNLSGTDDDPTQARHSLPLWKKERDRFVAVALLVAVATLVVLLGSRSTADSNKLLELPQVPTTIPSPSDFPTPFLDTTVSPKPSPCLSTTSSISQKIQLEPFDPYFPNIAIHGRNVIVSTNSGFILFYSLSDRGWLRMDTFYNDDFYDSLVSISGEVAVVACTYATTEIGNEAGSIYIFEKIGGSDRWIQKDGPVVPEDGGGSYSFFGWSVDVDDNLIVVGDHQRSLYFFQKGRYGWMQIATRLLPGTCDGASFGYRGVVVENGIIVAENQCDGKLYFYRHNPDSNTVEEFQDALPHPFKQTDYFLDLNASGRYIVCSSLEGVVVYFQSESNRPFAFLQHFNASDFDVTFGNVAALDEDVLLVGAYEKIHVFNLKSGNWNITLTLEYPGYDQVDVSGRSLLVGLYDTVDTFDMSSCTQPMPTDSPTITLAPTPTTPLLTTQIPTHKPSFSLSPSTVTSYRQQPSLSATPSENRARSYTPSISSIPTTSCRWVEVMLVFDLYPDETWWEIRRINMANETDNSDVIIEWFSEVGDALENSTLYQRECLHEGKYEFRIGDLIGDGLCCNWGIGHYSLTSDGEVIAKGGEFELEEIASFSIPFVPSPVLSFNASPSPSLTPVPSKTCHSVEINITFDGAPLETSWVINRTNIIGGNIAFNESLHSFSPRDISLANHNDVRSVCLDKGTYHFSIYDANGDGICCGKGFGKYLVTWNGTTIGRGGEFDFMEVTEFKIPYSPPD